MGSWKPYLKFMAAGCLAFAAGSQFVHIAYKPLAGFEDKVKERAEEIKKERNELLYVPDSPTWGPVDPRLLPDVPNLDDAMIEHLERISLVEFNNEEGVQRLKSAIEYANQLHVVDTTGVEPMYSVLEDRELLLDDDRVTGNVSKEEVLQNAMLIEEDYFVAPPGNIPLTKANKLRKTEQTDRILEKMSERSDKNLSSVKEVVENIKD